jgi:hypothetical protein
MTDAEFDAHVRALSAKELEEEIREFLDEYKRLHPLYFAHKWQHPEDKERRVALFRELGELRIRRVAELAAAENRALEEAFLEV